MNLYTILIREDNKNKISVSIIREKDKKTAFQCYYQKYQKSNNGLIEYNKVHQYNFGTSFLNKNSIAEFGITLYRYFQVTRKATFTASKNKKKNSKKDWTPFWYHQVKKNANTFKMYNCSSNWFHFIINCIDKMEERAKEIPRSQSDPKLRKTPPTREKLTKSNGKEEVKENNIRYKEKGVKENNSNIRYKDYRLGSKIL